MMSFCLPSAWGAESSAQVGALAAARKDHTATLLSSGEVLVVGGSAVATMNSTESYQPATAQVTAGPPLGTGRSLHTATLLANGRLLVAGGRDSTGQGLLSTEVFNPATRAWSAAGSLAAARYGHTATLLMDGKILVAGGRTDESTPLGSSEIYDPQTGQWSPTTGGMSGARHAHTAILMADGKVLVAGGIGASGQTLATLDVFDPSTGTWTAGGLLRTARHHHVSVRLQDGNVLNAGGQDGGFLTDAEIYSVGAGTSAQTGSLSTGRSHSTASLLPDGRVLLFGGRGSVGFLSGAEIFNPATSAWGGSISMGTARHSHVATVLPHGQVIVTGGLGQAGEVAAIERFQSLTPTWQTSLKLPEAKHTPGASLLASGKLLVHGGFRSPSPLETAALYDPLLNTWSATGSLATRRYRHSSLLLHDGRVLAVAGSGTGNTFLSSCEIYQSSSGNWVPTGSLTTGSHSHAALILTNGKVLVAGGRGAAGTLARAELFNPVAGTWQATGTLSGARYSAGSTLLADGRVFIVGGISADGEALRTAEIYNPATGSWSSAGNMTARRESPSAALMPDGRVLVTGGADLSTVPQATVEIYNPATGTWSAAASFQTARYLHNSAVLPNGQILVCGGLDTTYNQADQVEIYDPILGTWSTTSSMLSGRYSMVTAFLGNGRLLVAGGIRNGLAVDTAEQFDFGVSFLPAARPLLSTASFNSSDKLVVTGSGFTARPEGSGGTTQNSPSNFPKVSLRHLANGQSVSVTVDPDSSFTDTTLTSSQVLHFPVGHALLTVTSGGVPSFSQVIFVPEPAVPKLIVQQPEGSNLGSGSMQDFGLVAVGEEVSRTFTVQNGGRADLTGINVSFDGGNASLFSLTVNPASSLSGPGGTTTFTVRYAPTSVGPKSTTLKLVSNDPDIPLFQLTLRGTNLSSNADLSGLALSYGTVTPAFSPSTLSYSLEVPNGVSTLALTPVTAQAAATVRVNNVPVNSGQPSQAVPLAEGSNTITIVVRAEDGVVAKTYTLTVGRSGPVEMVVEEPAGFGLLDGGARSYGPILSGTTLTKSFVIKNLGTDNLTGLIVTKSGTNPADFVVLTAPVAPVAANGSTTFTVQFKPTTGGAKSASLHISSNDVVRDPFDIALTGRSLAFDQDGDGDGLSDAAEFQMSALGFDWQVAQAALVSTYFSTAQGSGLFTESQIQALHVDKPLLKRNAQTGQFTVTLGLRTASDLVNYSPLAFTAPQVTITPQGKIEFRFTPAGSKLFLRLDAQ